MWESVNPPKSRETARKTIVLKMAFVSQRIASSEISEPWTDSPSLAQMGREVFMPIWSFSFGPVPLNGHRGLFVAGMRPNEVHFSVIWDSV
jgi:hypothetical protein